ncbi:MAG: HAD-IA family hydrolase [Candidatus Bathyarchaeota archaeon]|nr:HAD-IA family hydrolase [Candidatus Bathyarchaeota archaeon]
MWSKSVRKNVSLQPLLLRAITFDDFLTLRFPVGEGEDIILPILKALKRQELDVNDEEFLKQYFREDELYRKRLKETHRESLLDDIVMKVLAALGHETKPVSGIVREAVDYGLTTRITKWFPDAKRTLLTLRKKGYKLGLISNTHWRFSIQSRNEFRRFFDVITLSYEHGYAKPHPSIFLDTLKKLRTNASECLHVGDDPVADIDGAKRVGMRTAFIRRRETKAEADIEIEQLSELTTL